MESVSEKSSPPLSAESAGRTEPSTQLRSASRLSTLTGAQVLSIAGYVPPQVVLNQDLAQLGYDADWIVQRTGIHERRRATSEEATSHLAEMASRECLRRAGVQPGEIDLILVATITPDTPSPSTACHLQRRLGASAPAMDIGAACAGFMYALVTGMQFIASGTNRRVLVVGADCMTRVVNPADHKTYPLFGDGAGAALLGPGRRDQGLLAYTLGADGSGGDLLEIPGGGVREPLTTEGLVCGRQYLHMDGRAVFKWAVRMLSDTVLDVLQHASLSQDDIDLVAFHQANQRIIDAAVSGLGIDPGRVLTNLDRYGNTSAASIPLVLDEAMQAGRLNGGDRVLLSGFGAGLAWGTAVFNW